MKKDMMEPARYEYMTLDDSRLYDAAKESDAPFAKEVVRLLELMANISRQAHRNSWQ